MERVTGIVLVEDGHTLKERKGLNTLGLVSEQYYFMTQSCGGPTLTRLGKYRQRLIVIAAAAI
jgi:hypothetical protein